MRDSGRLMIDVINRDLATSLDAGAELTAASAPFFTCTAALIDGTADFQVWPLDDATVTYPEVHSAPGAATAGADS